MKERKGCFVMKHCGDLIHLWHELACCVC